MAGVQEGRGWEDKVGRWVRPDLAEPCGHMEVFGFHLERTRQPSGVLKQGGGSGLHLRKTSRLLWGDWTIGGSWKMHGDQEEGLSGHHPTPSSPLPQGL